MTHNNKTQRKWMLCKVYRKKDGDELGLSNKRRKDLSFEGTGYDDAISLNGAF